MHNFQGRPFRGIHCTHSIKGPHPVPPCLTLRNPLPTPVDIQQHLRSVFVLSQRRTSVLLYSKDIHPY